MDEAFEKAMQEPLTGVDRLRAHLSDQEAFPAPDIDDCECIAEHIDRLENALLKIASMSHSQGLLWWQVEARKALGINSDS